MNERYRAGNTFAQDIKSSQTGRSYTLSVSVPGDEISSCPRPLLVVLDAPYALGTTTESLLLQEMGGELLAPIVVGISTAGGIKDHAVQRVRDFTPPDFDVARAKAGPVGNMLCAAANNAGKSLNEFLGGADAFLSFLCDDVLPDIAARIDINMNNVALFGHSAGAVFCRFALLSRPSVFRKMIIGSMGVGWYGENWQGLETSFWSTSPPITPELVFQGVGAIELGHSVLGPSLQSGMDAMLALATAADGSLTLTQRIIAEHTHCSVMAPLAAAGFRRLYGTGDSFLDAL